jgi:hypothetical protein
VHGALPSHFQPLALLNRIVKMLYRKGNLEDHTFALAFLQLRQAFLVTDSGTLRRLEALLLLPASISARGEVWTRPDPADSAVGAEMLLSPEGRIFRNGIIEVKKTI